jgi:hypothetical protein
MEKCFLQPVVRNKSEVRKEPVFVKTSIERRGFTIAGLVLALTLGACLMPNPTEAAIEPVTLEIVSTPVASVTEAKVVRDGKDLVISGKVWKQHEFLLPGHVDIVICDPKGSAVAMETPRVSGFASNKGGVKEARFTARIKQSLPAGSTVRVRYHAPSSGDDHLKCA